MLPIASVRRPVLIAGPTASGKSALALAVAARDDGVVVNADALQVYAGWRVLTARPTPEDERRHPHALYGHVRRRAAYSVGHWLREVAPVLEDAARSGRRAVIVGGTGLYLSALTNGLAPIPPVPAAVRLARRYAAGRWRDRGAGGGAREARPGDTWARIDRRNPARVRRAWEVLEATGTGLAEWQRGKAQPLVAPDAAVRLVLNPPSAVLSARIAARFDAMLAARRARRGAGGHGGRMGPAVAVVQSARRGGAGGASAWRDRPRSGGRGRRGGDPALCQAAADVVSRADGGLGLAVALDLVPDLDQGPWSGRRRGRPGCRSRPGLGSVSGWAMSRTCRMRSASSTSSSVARKAATSWVGRSEMKPTVSDRMILRPMRQAIAAHRRVERGEQHVLGQHVGPGQPVEQR
jgi:tRNA dimethylallyltransferase